MVHYTTVKRWNGYTGTFTWSWRARYACDRCGYTVRASERAFVRGSLNSYVFHQECLEVMQAYGNDGGGQKWLLRLSEAAYRDEHQAPVRKQGAQTPLL